MVEVPADDVGARGNYDAGREYLAGPADGAALAAGGGLAGGAGIADGAARESTTGVADGAQLLGAAGGAAEVEQAGAPTIYDVARAAGVSIASVSRVLNDQRNPRPETRDRVLRAVAELGFVPDGAARALSARLKEVIGVVVRRPFVAEHAGAGGPGSAGRGDGAVGVGSADGVGGTVGVGRSAGVDRAAGVDGADDGGAFADEAESLQFPDMLNRGIERAAQRCGFDLLVRSVDGGEHDPGKRIVALARKSDGLILHDRVLDPRQLDRLSRHVPVVTLAGVPTPTTANVRSDNVAGMRALARHLLCDHGYRTIGYLSGFGDSPDNLARRQVLTDEVTKAGAELVCGPSWQGNYFAAGGAAVTARLIETGSELPRAIVCANDQTALGVMYVLRRNGVAVPGDVAVTGYDDIPMARHLHPQLTSVRQPIRELGETAFEVLYAMIGRERPAERDIVLPVRLIRRESCGCPPQGDPDRGLGVA